MKCVVPLAGPDLYTEKYGLRPLYPFEGEAILVKTLALRPWVDQLQSQDYVFVVRDIPEAAPLLGLLCENWPGCTIVRLSHLTGGGMLSALAGVAAITVDEPIIVDLADILILDSGMAIDFSDPQIGAIVPVFDSDENVYSYLIEDKGMVVGAKEKMVVSRNASAGVYIFKDRATFIAAAAHSLNNAADMTFKGGFFVCPMVNGVITSGLRVLAPRVKNIIPVGKIFH